MSRWRLRLDPEAAQYQRDYSEFINDNSWKDVENQVRSIPGEWSKVNAAGGWTALLPVTWPVGRV